MKVRSTRSAAPIFAVLLIVSPFFETGCAKRVPLTTAQTVTLDLNQALASLATMNKTMASDVISLNNAGAIKQDLANSVLNYNRLVAQSVIAGVEVQKTSGTPTERAAAVKAALAKLRLPPDVAAVIASPQADQALAGLINTIDSVQSLIRAIVGPLVPAEPTGPPNPPAAPTGMGGY
jgi:hypothetical protein